MIAFLNVGVKCAGETLMVAFVIKEVGGKPAPVKYIAEKQSILRKSLINIK